MRWVIISFSYIVEAFKIIIMPYIVLSCIACIVNKKSIFKWQYKHIPLFTSLVYIMSVLLITGVGRIGQYQFDFSVLSYQLVLFQDEPVLTMLLNLIMFFPFGILAPITWHDFFYSWKRIAVVGGLSSVLIEVIQTLFLGRLGDINDVVMNTAGCIIGYAAYKVIDFRALTVFLKSVWPLLLLATCIPISGVCIADMIAWHVGINLKYIGSTYIKIAVIMLTILSLIVQKIVYKHK